LAPDGGEKAEWAPESVWTFWRTEKSFISGGVRIPGREARSLVTTPSAFGCVVLCIVCVDCVVLCIVCVDCVVLCTVCVDCVVLCIVCVDCVVLCIVCVDCVVLCIVCVDCVVLCIVYM
jgi:hypothetical protein